MKEAIRSAIVLAAIAALAAMGTPGCGGKHTETDTGEDDGATDAADTTGDADAIDSPDEDATDAAEDADATEPMPLTGATLPQAVSGAMWANPDVYAEIPVHVACEGTAESVTVAIDAGTPVAAADDDGDGDWVASVPIDALADGDHDLVATASAAGAGPFEATATLVTGTQGVQLTDFSAVGMSGVPRIHRVGEELWITWTDRSEGDGEAWLREMDGAGRWTTDRVAIASAGEETLYARTAMGDSSIAVLYQGHGSPYSNHFKVVDATGADLLASMDLDSAGFTGAFGGEVTFDGTGFVAVWREVSLTTSDERVLWMRVEEGTWDVTGPIQAAIAGAGTAGDPIGGFDPFTFLDVATTGDLSMVGFVRYRWSGMLDMAIPKAQLALVSADGTVGWTAYAGVEGGLTFDRECRTFETEDGVLAVWSSVDLLDPSTSPPNLFYATGAGPDGTLDPARGVGELMFEQVDDRDEPFVLARHPDHLGVMAWWDHRAYTTEWPDGHIDLYAAAVEEDLTATGEVVFPHARCIAGTTHLNAAAAGTNMIMAWIDERHGGGVMDPRPEVYLETAWF